MTTAQLIAWLSESLGWVLQTTHPSAPVKCLLFPWVKSALTQSSLLPVGLRGPGWGCFILRELEEKPPPVNSVGHTPSGFLR